MIPLTQGKFALVDEADAEWILGMGSWHATWGNCTWYARGAACGRPRVFMHALIAGTPGPDHVNGNGLDNRRANLREATQSQNSANRELSSSNTSGYKGVSWSRGTRKWVAQIGVNGRRIYLGLFADPAEGARAYNRAALEHFGEFARLNPLPDMSEFRARVATRRHVPVVAVLPQPARPRPHGRTWGAHVKIARRMEAAIRAGELPAGTKLPPVRAIGEQDGVSMGTAHRAVAALRAKGLIETKGRAGSFVTATGHSAA